MRADKVLSPEQAEELLSDAVRVEEKVDGDNLGISVQAGELRVQHRGDYVRPDEGGRYPHRSRRGWRPMSLASPKRSGSLSSSANGARRSTPCATTLPDWFLAFDVYDRGRAGFWSADRRDALCASLGAVPASQRVVFD